jgi:UDP-sugar transporter A1/2/3
MFIIADGGGSAGFGGGWSWLALAVATLGAAGGLLVALSIKYGDSILKTLATTSAIVLSSVLDHYLLQGPLTPIMVLAGSQVVLSICDYTFDQSAATEQQPPSLSPIKTKTSRDEKAEITRIRQSSSGVHEDDEEQIALIEQGSRDS